MKARGLDAVWRELKRRKVPHVAGIYLGSGFAVAQVADLFFPRLGMPDWTVTAVIVVIVLGFPVGVLLAGRHHDRYARRSAGSVVLRKQIR